MGLSDFIQKRRGRGSKVERDRVEQPRSLNDLVPGRISLADCHKREECLVAGEVRAIGQEPIGKRGSFKVTLEDGSNRKLDLVWLGTGALPGIRVGSLISARGTVQQRGSRIAMIDPEYTILDSGE